MKIIDIDLDYIHDNLADADFNNSSILITGGAGFLGYYLVNYLIKFLAFHNINEIVILDAFIFEKPKWLLELENCKNLKSNKIFCW